MKKLILILSFIFTNILFAEEPQTTNVFSETENNQSIPEDDENQFSTNSEPTGPGDPVSINDFLVVLGVLGSALVLFHIRRKDSTI